MSASEPIAGRILDAATEGHKADRDAMLKTAEDHPSLKRAADSYAKRMEVKQAAVNKLFQPVLELLGFSKNYFQDDFATDMAPRLDAIPDDHVQAPKASIAGPAIEALRYNLDEPDLKTLYLNLLANASDSRKNDVSHPSYVEILKQISAEEARLLGGIFATETVAHPMMRIEIIVSKDGVEQGRNVTHPHLLPETIGGVSGFQAPTVPTYVDNWGRLGLFSAIYDSSLIKDGIYDWFSSNPAWAYLLELEIDANTKYGTTKGVLRSTVLGGKFAEAAGISGPAHKPQV